MLERLFTVEAIGEILFNASYLANLVLIWVLSRKLQAVKRAGKS